MLKKRLEEKNVSNKLRKRIMDILYTGRQKEKVFGRRRESGKDVR